MPELSDMKRISARLTAALDWCLALGLIAMVLVVCANVLLRYVWGRTIPWADEALIFAMIGIAYLGLWGVSLRNQHLRMSVFSQMAGKRAEFALALTEQIVTIFVCLFVSYHGWTAIARLFGRGTRSNMAEVPLWLVNGLVLIGLIGVAFIAVLRLVELLGSLRHGGPDAS